MLGQLQASPQQRGLGEPGFLTGRREDGRCLRELCEGWFDFAERGACAGRRQASLGGFGRRGARFAAHDQLLGQLQRFSVPVQAGVAADHLERDFDHCVCQASPLGSGEGVRVDPQCPRELALAGVQRGDVVLHAQHCVLLAVAFEDVASGFVQADGLVEVAQ